MDQIINEGLDLNVVGIIKAKADVENPMLSSGIYYPYELTIHLIEEAMTYDVVKQQLADENFNVFTGKSFEADTELAPNDLFSLEDLLVSINPNYSRHLILMFLR